MNDIQKHNLQKNDPPVSMPDDTTFSDPLARMRTRLSCYIARRRDGLEDSLDPDDPDGLAHKVGQLAFHLRQFLSLKRDLSSLSPEMIEGIDNFRQAGGLDAYPQFTDIDTETETSPYQPVFVSHYPTTRDSEEDS